MSNEHEQLWNEWAGTQPTSLSRSCVVAVQTDNRQPPPEKLELVHANG